MVWLGEGVSTMSRRLEYCTVVLAALLAIELGALAEPSCTIAVRPDESLQQAINVAPEGAVLCLEDGIWEENIEIGKSLTLRGTGAEHTLVKAEHAGKPVIRVASLVEAEVRLEELTVADARRATPRTYEEAGVRILGRAHVLIVGAVIRANSDGIYMWDSSRLTVESSLIVGNEGSGLVMWDSSRASIAESTIEGNGKHGIYLWGSAELALTHSSIFDNTGHGVALHERPCIDVAFPFQGVVTGRDNEIPGPGDEGGNMRGAVCPVKLEFLITVEGGEFDRRGD